jgi:hypothetical protein
MSDFKVINSSELFKSVVKYMDRGSATTPEVIIMEKRGVQFNVTFKFSFTYDWSNGMDADKPELTIVKSNGKEATKMERITIESYIQKNYKW